MGGTLQHGTSTGPLVNIGLKNQSTKSAWLIKRQLFGSLKDF